MVICQVHANGIAHKKNLQIIIIFKYGAAIQEWEWARISHQR